MTVFVRLLRPFILVVDVVYQMVPVLIGVAVGGFVLVVVRVRP